MTSITFEENLMYQISDIQSHVHGITTQVEGIRHEQEKLKTQFNGLRDSFQHTHATDIQIWRNNNEILNKILDFIRDKK